jgi:hypothetical protein
MAMLFGRLGGEAECDPMKNELAGENCIEKDR